jgi:hypothetical protein
MRLDAFGRVHQQRRPADAAALVRVPRVEGLEQLLAAGVGDDRERQVPAPPERLVAAGGVNRDRDDLGASLVQLGLLVRQPDQLAAAIRSPVAAIGDEDERAVGPAKPEHVGHGPRP